MDFVTCNFKKKEKDKNIGLWKQCKSKIDQNLKWLAWGLGGTVGQRQGVFCCAPSPRASQCCSSKGGALRLWPQCKMKRSPMIWSFEKLTKTTASLKEAVRNNDFKVVALDRKALCDIPCSGPLQNFGFKDVSPWKALISNSPKKWTLKKD